MNASVSKTFYHYTVKSESDFRASVRATNAIHAKRKFEVKYSLKAISAKRAYEVDKNEEPECQVCVKKLDDLTCSECGARMK